MRRNFSLPIWSLFHWGCRCLRCFPASGHGSVFTSRQDPIRHTARHWSFLSGNPALIYIAIRPELSAFPHSMSSGPSFVSTLYGGSTCCVFQSLSLQHLSSFPS